MGNIPYTPLVGALTLEGGGLMKRTMVCLLTLALLTFGLTALTGCGGSGSTGGGGGGTTPGGTGGGGGATVTIKNFAFSPASVEIAVGETVTWTNEDSATHTVTGDDGIDSGSLAQGKTFTHTFASAGTFSYHCSIHPNMNGTVTVK